MRSSVPTTTSPNATNIVFRCDIASSNAAPLSGISSARINPVAAAGMNEMLAKQVGEGREYEIKSKVIILLTDGENNAGLRSVQEAADLAVVLLVI